MRLVLEFRELRRTNIPAAVSISILTIYSVYQLSRNIKHTRSFRLTAIYLVHLNKPHLRGHLCFGSCKNVLVSSHI